MEKQSSTPLSGKVNLRDVQESDLVIFYEQQLEPEANEMASFPARDRETFMAHWQKIMRDKSNVLRTILFDGQIAGNIVSFERQGMREVGYWLGKEFWGKGIATRSLAQFLDEIRIRPLHARVAKHNLGSLRVLQKCGFAIIGEDIWLTTPGGDEVEDYLLELTG